MSEQRAEVPPSLLADCADSIGTLCSVFVTAAQGMMVTSRYLAKPSEIVTMRYPLEKRAVASNYRGRLINEIPRCISCELCAKVCPTQCITLDHEAGADKKRILTHYDIDMTICLYCGLCTEICPDTTRDEVTNEKCLTMKGGYEYSSSRKETLGFFWKVTAEELTAQKAAAQERADKQKAEAAVKAAALAAAKAAAEAAAPAAPAAPATPAASPAPVPAVPKAAAPSSVAPVPKSEPAS